MPREKRVIDETVGKTLSRLDKAMKDTRATLYATEVSGSYPDFGMTPEQFREAATKRIERLLSDGRKSVDKRTLDHLSDEYSDWMRTFDGFRKSSPQMRGEVLRIAKERHIPIEEAYRLKAGTSRN